MGMERVQLTVQDNVRTYSVYKDITTGIEYYFDGTSYYLKSGDNYVPTSTHAENLQIVWNNYRATIMMTYDKDTDPHNKAQEWTYNKRNDLPKYTFANPMNRAEYPAENSAEYGSKSDGTAISYTVSPVGYYANIGSDESPIYVAWSNSSTSYSGPSGGMVEATASVPNPEINHLTSIVWDAGTMAEPDYHRVTPELKGIRITVDDTAALKGDVTQDGIINSKDAAAVLQYAAKVGTGGADITQEEHDLYKQLGDVNDDGAVNAKDANGILLYAAAIGTNTPTTWAKIFGSSEGQQ